MRPRIKTKTEKVTFMFTWGEKKSLERLADLHEMTMSDVMRRALKELVYSESFYEEKFGKIPEPTPEEIKEMKEERKRLDREYNEMVDRAMRSIKSRSDFHQDPSK